jgi:uncharacterized protein YndB with AHSA1/START domain
MKLITVKATINAPLSQVWEKWTNAHHVTKWNFASPDWHCPSAENNLVEGGEFHYLMAAKDGSFQFDFWGTYQKITIEKSLDITIGDGRKMFVSFEKSGNQTIIEERFEPEHENSEELQQAGWQAILDNFKQYAESSLTPS